MGVRVANVRNSSGNPYTNSFQKLHSFCSTQSRNCYIETTYRRDPARRSNRYYRLIRLRRVYLLKRKRVGRITGDGGAVDVGVDPDQKALGRLGQGKGCSDRDRTDHCPVLEKHLGAQ